MTDDLRSRLVVFSEVSALLLCWSVRLPMTPCWPVRTHSARVRTSS